MVGAFLGAAVAVVLSTAFASRVPGSNVASRARTAAFDAPAGSCLAWSKQDTSDIHKVVCTAPHLMELTGSADLSGDFPKDAQFPDQLNWRQIVDKGCTQITNDYLGGRFDPYGKFTITALQPSRNSWRSGDRTMRCGLESVTPSVKLLPIIGNIAGQDQSDVHEPGTCLGINDKAVSDPVDCSQPHSYEIVGVADLGPAFPNQFPSDGNDGKQDHFLNTECARLAADYAGGGDIVNQKNLHVTWDTRKQESWLAGSHKVDCKVGAALPDFSGLAPVSGSVKGDVRISTPTAAPPPSGSSPEG